MTHADLTAAGIGSRSKLSAIEAGTTKVKRADIYAFATLYRLTPDQTEQLHALAEAASTASASNAPVTAISAGLDLVDGDVRSDLLDCVAVLRVHATTMIPALVQTEDYARAALAADATLTTAIVDRRLAVLQRRRQALSRRAEPVRLELVVAAGALEPSVGSAQVMAQQQEHLRSLDATDHVSIRVLTAEDGLYAPMGGPFSLLEFDDPLDPPLVYVPSLVDGRYFERADYLTVYRHAFDTVSQLAVPLKDYPAWSRDGPQPS